MKIGHTHTEWRFSVLIIFCIINVANATITREGSSADASASASSSQQQQLPTPEQLEAFFEGIPEHEKQMYVGTVNLLKLVRKLPTRVDLIILKHFPLLPNDAQELITNIYQYYQGLPRFSPFLQKVENEILSAIYRYKYGENMDWLSLKTELEKVLNDVITDEKKQADILAATNVPGNEVKRTIREVSGALCNRHKIPNPTTEYFQTKTEFEEIFELFPNLPREACVRMSILVIVWKTLALDPTKDEICMHYKNKAIRSIEAYFTKGSQANNRNSLSIEILVILYNMLDIYEYRYLQYYKKAQNDPDAPLDFFTHSSPRKSTTTQGPIGLQLDDSAPTENDPWSFLTDDAPTLSRPLKKSRIEEGQPSEGSSKNSTQEALLEPGWVAVFPSDIYPDIYLITRYLRVVKLQLNIQEVLFYFKRHCLLDEKLWGKVQWTIYSVLQIYRNQPPNDETFCRFVSHVLADILTRYGPLCHTTTVRHKITLTPGSIENDPSVVNPLPDIVTNALRTPIMYPYVPIVSGQQHQTEATSSQKSQGKQVEDTSTAFQFPSSDTVTSMSFTDFMHQSTIDEMTDEQSHTVPSLSETYHDDPSLSLQLSLMPSSNPPTPRVINISDEEKETDS